MRTFYVLAALSTLAAIDTADAQQPLPPCPTSPWIQVPCDTTLTVGQGRPDILLPGAIYVQISNHYDVTLAVMGLASQQRDGIDFAEGVLIRDGQTFRGVMQASQWGDMSLTSPWTSCSDHSDAQQDIYAVAHIEEPSTGLVAGQSAWAGSAGGLDLTFYFFPVSPPVFRTGMPACQTVVGFEGYGMGANDNQAPYSWLPQVQPRGEFIPLNDTKWTTQIGLRLHAPPAPGVLGYTDTRDVVPSSQVNSVWHVYMERSAD